jgi:hypothetical protein
LSLTVGSPLFSVAVNSRKSRDAIVFLKVVTHVANLYYIHFAPTVQQKQNFLWQFSKIDFLSESLSFIIEKKSTVLPCACGKARPKRTAGHCQRRANIGRERFYYACQQTKA